jgi:hypothetical protein
MLRRVLQTIVLGLILLPQIVVAESLVEQLRICAQTKDSLVRLMCYDKIDKGSSPIKVREAVKLKNKVPPPVVIEKAPSIAIVTEVKKQDDSFGHENLEKVKSVDEREHLILIVASVNKDARNNLRFVFENGQSWRQTAGGNMRIKVKDRVKIYRGSLGAFYLSKVNQNRSITVRRIK